MTIYMVEQQIAIFSSPLLVPFVSPSSLVSPVLGEGLVSSCRLRIPTRLPWAILDPVFSTDMDADERSGPGPTGEWLLTDGDAPKEWEMSSASWGCSMYRPWWTEFSLAESGLNVFVPRLFVWKLSAFDPLESDSSSESSVELESLSDSPDEEEACASWTIRSYN